MNYTIVQEIWRHRSFREEKELRKLNTRSVSHAHFLCTFSLRDVQTRTRMAPGVCSAVSYLSISLSPFSCFIRRLCCSRTVTSTPRSRPHRLRRALPDPKARVKRTSARAPVSLATWPIPRTPQVMSPRSSNLRGWWHDAHQRSGPQFLGLLENHKREHKTNFTLVILFLREETKKACNRETFC